MNELLGKRVYYTKKRYNAYSLDKDEWYLATIVGLFRGGNVLVEDNSNELYEMTLDDIAFTEEFIDLQPSDRIDNEDVANASRKD